jgi:hypothetical protein
VIYLILAWFSDMAQLRIAGKGYNNLYCGMGAVDTVNQRRAAAPMAYRVLVPWLIWLGEWVIPRGFRLTALYEPLKIALMAAVLWATAHALGAPAAYLLAALWPITYYFDYWDWAAESFGLAAALTGTFPLALVGGVVHGLSRETAPLVALTYALVTHDWIGAMILAGVIAVVMGGVRLWAGRKELYCERVMWPVNLRDVRGILRNRPVYLSEIGMTLAITILTMVTILMGKAGPAWPVPLALLIAGWVLARAAEPRVFAGCLLWIVMLVG